MRTLSFGAALVALCLAGVANAGVITSGMLVDLDFNSGVDALSNSEGNLVFNGVDGFQVTFTDDNSDGPRGGQANGVHLTSANHANAKVGQSDLVMGANNLWVEADNYHSSGIVANFNKGVNLVRFFDTDNDSTTKSLFAFDAAGNLIGQTAADSQITFTISLANTGGQAIYSVEFDTIAGIHGGAEDGTYFTIDDFYVEGPIEVPEPATMAMLAMGGLALLRRRRS